MRKVWMALLIALLVMVAAACSNNGNSDVASNEPAASTVDGTTEVQAQERIEAPASNDGIAEQPSAEPEKSSQPAETAEPTTYRVEIVDFAFVPASLEIEAGSVVEFINLDAVKHTATGNNDEFDTGLLAKDESMKITFDKAGDYGYYCKPHPGMTATITVK